MKNADPAAAHGIIKSISNKQAKFLIACFRDFFHYCAYHLQEIARNVRDVDLAMRWGFGWRKGLLKLGN